MQKRAQQQDLIDEQRLNMKYGEEIKLSVEPLEELKLWVNNLTLSQGTPVKLGNPDLVIYTNASSEEDCGCFPGARDINRGIVEQAGERKLSHKRVRTFSNRNCPEKIFEEQGEQANSHIHRQHDCPRLSSPQMRDKSKTLTATAKRI